MARPDGSSGKAMRDMGALSAVGLSLALAVILGAALGYGIDRWFGTSPWGFLIGFFVGLAAGIRSAFQTVASVSQGTSPDSQRNE
jgi:ATP synthase protein I